MQPRLGSIQFINSLPVDWAMLNGIVPVDAQIIQGTPAWLNEQILENKLDISPISAFWYAQHQKNFLLLPSLSISSQSSVQSVLLFSRFPIDRLKDKTIHVTDQGRTTPALLEIILRLRYRFLPKFKTNGTKRGIDDVLSDESDAVLLIGDEALLASNRAKKNQALYVIDLAEEWQGWTNTPVVFAVWAVRRDFFECAPEKVQAVYASILKSRGWGFSHLEDILKIAAERTELRRDELENYFSQLSYDFDEEAETGMRLYFNYAAKCGLLPPVGVFHDIAESYVR